MHRHALSCLALSVTMLSLAACSSDAAGTSSATGTTGATGGGGAGGGSATGGGGSAPADLAIQTYASDPMGPAVNSHLITGAKDAILVDGQFFTADADKVVAMVKASGKTLTTVFLTHAHPDHYLGLGVIGAAFPQAKIVATQAVVDDFNAGAAGTLAYLKTTPFGAQIPDTLVTLSAVTGSGLELEGQTLQILELPEPGESKVAGALLLEHPSALLAGDLVYHDVHLVLSECDAKGWLDNLAAIAKKGASAVYPGHGPKADLSVFADDAAYINAVVPLLDAAATADEAKAAIKQKYPAYQSDFLLGFSTDNYFMNCKPKP
jgi:glyoxylase-like metal-dependent hydrolase (beta-lactamase superfamily II)